MKNDKLLVAYHYCLKVIIEWTYIEKNKENIQQTFFLVFTSLQIYIYIYMAILSMNHLTSTIASNTVQQNTSDQKISRPVLIYLKNLCFMSLLT